MTVVESVPLIHGPLVTSRLGRVLTIDITAPQATMVVARDSVLPRASLVVTTAARRMIELSKAGEKVEHIVILGTGEDPIRHPNLREVTENLRALRDKWFQRAKLCIATRSVELEPYEVRSTLGMYDKVLVRFEWGTAKLFSAVTGEKGTSLASMTRALGQLDHVIIEASFFKGDEDNTSAAEVGGWIKKVQEVRPQEVHVLAAPQYPQKKLRAATQKQRQTIVEKLTEETGLTVSVHELEDLVPA
jgi:hypothetical protein